MTHGNSAVITERDHLVYLINADCTFSFVDDVMFEHNG